MKTINSVADQTALDFEFIIIDSASSDGSKELLQGNSANVFLSASTAKNISLAKSYTLGKEILTNP